MKELSLKEIQQVSGAATKGEEEALQIGLSWRVCLFHASTMNMTWTITFPVNAAILLVGGPIVGAMVGFGAYRIAGEAIDACNGPEATPAAQPT